jgi:hypothetical protein
MRKLLMTTVLAGMTLFTPGLTRPAHASHDWLEIGAVFQVGAAHIAFAFGRPSYGYEPAYYYRYDQPIRYRDHRCSQYCFHEAGYTYHHESCPLVAAHFSHYRIDPYWAYERYAPRYGGYYLGRDYRYRGGYDRDRYARPSYGHDSYRSHDRYERHDRYDDRNGRYDRNSRNDRYGRDHRYDRDDRYNRNDRSRGDHSRGDRSHGDRSHGDRGRERRHH